MSIFSPFFAWTNAVLKTGHAALDSMEKAAKRSRTTRVGVIPTADAPAQASAPAQPRASAKAAPARKRKPPMKAKGKAKARRR